MGIPSVDGEDKATDPALGEQVMDPVIDPVLIEPPTSLIECAGSC